MVYDYDVVLTESDVIEAPPRPRLLDELEPIVPRLVGAYEAARADGSRLSVDYGRALQAVAKSLCLTADARVFHVYEIARLAAIDHYTRRIPLNEAVVERVGQLASLARLHDKLRDPIVISALERAARDFAKKTSSKVDRAIAVEAVCKQLAWRANKDSVRRAVARERQARGMLPED